MRLFFARTATSAVAVALLCATGARAWRADVPGSLDRDGIPGRAQRRGVHGPGPGPDADGDADRPRQPRRQGRDALSAAAGLRRSSLTTSPAPRPAPSWGA